MTAETIQYDAGQHEAFASELNKIKSSFETVVTNLNAVKTMSSDNLDGNAAEALETAVDTLVKKLETEKENWQTTITNAGKVKELLIDADKQASNSISSR
ncbi:peptidase [Streptococcus pluranimalium]|uniref:peptidase n=1 Tax=Streptococcus pluranimalium TaxID=82348 RepID=UPI00346575DE